ncbi:NADH:flavin oxidoreductase/NADH oxidase [Bryobacter aggregatus]|uniref:NADH:flavin oxidoreductase/NADH oxidase n=1 Tax=Bryobacter aggregatus TaxID=360054 RepID=UPI0004E207E4|nr:NADH:flavin oxidoreductase/NADH oxidase [Bryobacter aggregatus]
MSESLLFSPLGLRELVFPNRIGVSPMCQYSALDGFVNDWHLTHLGARATGGAGLVIVEATAVVPEGRITPGCTGIWSDAHIAPLAGIAKFVKSQGSVPGIQLAHAGRKASCAIPWEGGAPLRVGDGAWQTVGPSAIPFDEGWHVPHELSVAEIAALAAAFGLAAKRALQAGFAVIELHGAHGYLQHEFLSPLSNHRTDAYGGSFENRSRFLRETIAAVRAEWPERLPLFLRISSSDWVEGGWTIEDSVALAKMVQPLGVDLIDCSSGGNSPKAKIELGPGYQVPFAEQIRREGGIASAAVGLIHTAQQAEEVIRAGQADLVLLGREILRDPYWPIHAAQALGVPPKVPNQYLRAI